MGCLQQLLGNLLHRLVERRGGLPGQGDDLRSEGFQNLPDWRRGLRLFHTF